MARYKVVDRSPRFLPISLEAQLMVGSFEHALDVLVDEELELSAFERWYCNDETGAPAYDPAVMLKIVLLAYSKGIVSTAERIERLQGEARRIREFLATHAERRSTKGTVRKSNVTDNDSAKMATQKGVIQGYTAVAAVDERAQIIVAAHALGSGSEQAVLLPIVDLTASLRTNETIITADAGYHSEENLRGLCERAVPAMIADGLMRKRDPRFADQARHKAQPDPLYDKTPKRSIVNFQPKDFIFDPLAGTCVCPAGKKLYSTGSACSINGRKYHKFRGAKRDCVPCELRARCLRHPEHTPTRQVALFEKNQASALPYTQIMKQAIDSERGKALYGRRIATVEPVFANLRYNKRLDHFTLRTQSKVNTQWHLYCLVHNIEKLAHHGYGAKAGGSAA